MNTSSDLAIASVAAVEAASAVGAEAAVDNAVPAETSEGRSVESVGESARRVSGAGFIAAAAGVPEAASAVETEGADLGPNICGAKADAAAGNPAEAECGSAIGAKLEAAAAGEAAAGTTDVVAAEEEARSEAAAVKPEAATGL